MSAQVTVVIPTLNAGPGFGRLLEAIKSQTVSCEILVIDSSSADDTVAVAQSAGAKAVVIKREDFDHGGTRSLAVDHAQGDIVVFMTQDAVPATPYAIENLIKPFSCEDVGAAYGRQLPGAGASPFAEHLRLFKYPDKAFVKRECDKGVFGIETPFLSDSFSAYRKAALQEIGLFKKGIIFAEDVHAGARLILAGRAIAYAPDAQVFHWHNHSLLEELRRYFDTAVFYRTEAWIREAFGGNRSEAWRYTKSELLFLRKHHKGFILLQFFPRTALRFLGFALGVWYRMLPSSLCRQLSAHPDWWKKKRPA